MPSDATTPPRYEVRCWACSKLMAVLRHFVGAFEAKCFRCKVAWVTITVYENGELRFRCRYCGRSVDDGAILHADHVIAESKGGPTTLENLVTACQECNIGKSDKDIEGATVLP